MIIHQDINSIPDIVIYTEALLEKYKTASQDISKFKIILINLLERDLFFKEIILGKYSELDMLVTTHVGTGSIQQTRQQFANAFISKLEDGTILNTTEFNTLISVGYSSLNNQPKLLEFYDLVQESKDKSLKIREDNFTEINKIGTTLDNLKTEFQLIEQKANNSKEIYKQITDNYKKSIGEVATSSIGKHFWRKSTKAGNMKYKFQENRNLGILFLVGVIFFGLIIFLSGSANSYEIFQNLFLYPNITFGFFSTIIIIIYLVIHFNTKNFYFYQSLEEDYGLRTVISTTYLSLVNSIDDNQMEIRGEVTRELTKRLFEPMIQKHNSDADFVTPLSAAIKSLKNP